MKISFNPSNSNKNILDLIKNNKDIIFDLKGHSIFARGVEFKGTDTNTWRDIKINNVSIGSHTLDLRNGSNTTLTNTNGVVTINSTWRPVVDNLTSDSTTSSLSAKQGKVLKALIDGKSNSDHNHDDRYLKLTGGTMAGNALITFADSGSWGTDKGPQGARGGLYWTGQSDYAKLYAEETAIDNLDLVIQFGDDNSNGLSIRNKVNTQTSYISAGGVITTGTFKGNLDWSYITNKPSSLKNPYSFNVFGVVYDGSAAKTVTTSNFISQVSEATATITDGTMLITSTATNSGFADTNAVNVPYKRKAIHLWEYIKAKTDSLYATKGHSHDYLVVNYADDKSFISAYHNFQVLYAAGDNGIIGKPADVDAFGLFKFRVARGWSGQMLLANGGSLYIRSSEDAKMTNTLAWKTILDSSNYSGILDSRYYTESEVNSLLNAKLDRQNLSYGTWNPRGYHLAAGYYYNGGALSISENNGKMYVSVDGCFWQNEGQYRVLDTSDIGDIQNRVTLHQFLSATDVTWYPLIWGGDSHNNTDDSTGRVYKSYDKLSWQTSSQTLYATNIQTNNIKNLSIGGGIYWNSYVESASDGSEAASITLVRSGVAGGTTLVLSQMNDTNDTIQFKTNTAARLYHNSYPILTTQNTYVSNNKGYIYGNEITQVNNSDTLDNWHKDNIQWTGYITSSNSLSSYWFKMYQITVTGYQYNDITITFLVSEGFSKHFSIFHLKIRQNGTNHSGNYNLGVELRELVGNLRDKVVAYYNNSTGDVQLWGNPNGQYNTMNYTVLKKTTRIATDSSSLGILTAQSFSSVQTPPSTGYTRVTMARVGSVSYSDSTGSVHWNNVTNKPSTFNPAAHTHTVFKNNLMIKGTNGISDSASIHLGIGDSDTGFEWISDGVCQIYANDVAIGQWTSGGMNWFKNPTVNGNKVWNAGNDGSGSGLDADTLDGEHASSFVRAGYYESNDLNKLDTYSFIRSVNSNVSSTSPKGNTGWYNVIQLVHRNGAGDGPSYIGQIALGMTTNTNDMFFRGKRTDTWKTVIHSGNYTEFINNYYWANVKISTSSSTTTSPTVHTLTATRVCAGHNPGIDNSISCSNWFRSSGNTGWYNTTYYGGWYMSDTSWIRAYNGVGIYTSGQIYSSSSIRMGDILLEYTNEINNSANDGMHLNYRNSGNVSLCYGGGNVGIGTITPSYKLDVNGQMRASGFHHASVNSDNYMLLAGGGYKSFGGDDSTPIFLGCLDLYRGGDGTISSSFYCLGYSVPFTYTRGGNYCKIVIPDTTRLSFYIIAATASVNYSGGGMDTWTGYHSGSGAWWLHCYAFGWNEVRVKGFCLANKHNDSWWGGNPLWNDESGANRITVCIFGHVKYK